MKTTNLIEKQAINVVKNGQPVADINELKTVGVPFGGYKFKVNDIVEFADEITSDILQVSTINNGKATVYHVKVLINTDAIWIPIGQLRQRPISIESLKDYQLNYELATMPNYWAMLDTLKGKKIIVKKLETFQFQAFVDGKAAFTEVIIDNQPVQRPVTKEREIPIFELL